MPCSIHLERFSLEIRLSTSLTRSRPWCFAAGLQRLYRVTEATLRGVNEQAPTGLRLAPARKAQVVNEAILVDATAEVLL